MLEQSFLPDYAGTRKAGAFAASFTAQILAAGVFVLIPLAFHETLAVMPKFTPIMFPLRHEPPLPVQTSRAVSSAPALAVAARRPLVAPPRVPASAPQSEPIDAGAAP